MRFFKKSLFIGLRADKTPQCRSQGAPRAVISIILGGVSFFSCAAACQATEKFDPHAPKIVEISNQRSISLASFEIATDDERHTTIAKTTQPIAAGEKFQLALKGAKGCGFVARWRYEDSNDEAVLDLCSDPVVILMD